MSGIDGLDGRIYNWTVKKITAAPRENEPAGTASSRPENFPSFTQTDQLLTAANILTDNDLLKGSAGKRLEIYQAILRTETVAPQDNHLAARFGLFSLYLEYNDFPAARLEYDNLLSVLKTADPATAASYKFALAAADIFHQARPNLNSSPTISAGKPILPAKNGDSAKFTDRRLPENMSF